MPIVRYEHRINNTVLTPDSPVTEQHINSLVANEMGRHLMDNGFIKMEILPKYDTSSDYETKLYQLRILSDEVYYKTLRGLLDLRDELNLRHLDKSILDQVKDLIELLRNC